MDEAIDKENGIAIFSTFFQVQYTFTYLKLLSLKCKNQIHSELVDNTLTHYLSTFSAPCRIQPKTGPFCQSTSKGCQQQLQSTS